MMEYLLVEAENYIKTNINAFSNNGFIAVFATYSLSGYFNENAEFYKIFESEAKTRLFNFS